MVGGDLELRGFHGNMSISKHSADLETTRFPWKPRDFQKNMLPLEPVLGFQLEFTPARSYAWKLFIFRGNLVVSMEIL